MLANPERGQHPGLRHADAPQPAGTGSVLWTVMQHTAWLDDPQLCASLARLDFSLAGLKREPMTVYLPIPPDRLRAYVGFVRPFIGLALDGISATPGRPVPGGAPPREFGQLGRMDRLVA